MSLPAFPSRTNSGLLGQDHRIQEAVCRELEAIADALPTLPDTARIERLSQLVQQITTEQFDRAESAFEQCAADGLVTQSQLNRLRDMQSLDAMHAQDMMETLRHRAQHRMKGPHTDLGYMLRCFFDGCRRAIAFKEAMLWPKCMISPIIPDRPDAPVSHDPEPGNDDCPSQRTPPHPV
ncbi:hypothetical protein GCM10023219_25010 [Stakelama sediminis]